jgi:hypothetical protein
MYWLMGQEYANDPPADPSYREKTVVVPPVSQGEDRGPGSITSRANNYRSVLLDNKITGPSPAGGVAPASSTGSGVFLHPMEDSERILQPDTADNIAEGLLGLLLKFLSPLAYFTSLP